MVQFARDKQVADGRKKVNEFACYFAGNEPARNSGARERCNEPDVEARTSHFELSKLILGRTQLVAEIGNRQLAVGGWQFVEAGYGTNAGWRHDIRCRHALLEFVILLTTSVLT